MYSNAVEDASQALKAFEGVLPSLAGGDGTLDRVQLAALQYLLENQELPTGVDDYLASLGLNNSDIENLLQGFESADLSALNDSVYDEILSLSTALSQLTTEQQTPTGIAEPSSFAILVVGSILLPVLLSFSRRSRRY